MRIPMDSTSSNLSLSPPTPNPTTQPLPVTATTINAASSSSTATPPTCQHTSSTSPATPTSTTTTSHKKNNYRKKRTKFVQFDPYPSFKKMAPTAAGRLIISSAASPSSSLPPSSSRPKPVTTKKSDSSAPKITPPCTECGKQFWSEKALYGHMRCHPERGWRGINPPPEFQRHSGPVINNPSRSFSPPHPPYASNYAIADELEVASSLLLLARGKLNGEGGGKLGYGVDQNTNRFEGTGFDQYTTRKKLPPCLSFPNPVALHKFDQNPNAELNCSSSIVVPGEERQMIGGDVSAAAPEEEEEIERMRIMGFTGGHRCGICSKVFSSGQALGGHKRCHWEKPSTSTSAAVGCFSDTSGGRREDGGGGAGPAFDFDLNLPAAAAYAGQSDDQEGFSDHDVRGSVRGRNYDDDITLDGGILDDCPSYPDLQLGLRLGL